MYANALILARADDVHAELVKRNLEEKNVPCAIRSASDFTTDALSGRLGGGAGPRLCWQDVEVDADTVVWWRRVTTPPGDERIWDREIRRFLRQERRHGLHGSLLATGCRIKNDPHRQARADHKPLQLRIAAANGLGIPRTCITNDIDTARAFYEELASEGKRCVYKPFESCRYHVAETRAIEDFDLDAEQLELAPVCFQECIERGLDLRVNVIGDEVFAAAIRPNFDDLIDWRLDCSAHFEPYSLDPETEQRLRQVRRDLGLDWGAFDLRIDPEGVPYFFEVNPSGQFLFVEAELGTPLVESFASMLLARD